MSKRIKCAIDENIILDQIRCKKTPQVVWASLLLHLICTVSDLFRCASISWFQVVSQSVSHWCFWASASTGLSQLLFFFGGGGRHLQLSAATKRGFWRVPSQVYATESSIFHHDFHTGLFKMGLLEQKYLLSFKLRDAVMLPKRKISKPPPFQKNKLQSFQITCSKSPV